MKRVIVVVGVLAALAAFADRPGNEYQLTLQLNGQPTRWVMPDGGRSGVFAATSSSCMMLTGGTVNARPTQSIVPNILFFVPLVAANVCARPSATSPVWDGGCNTIPGDENYGVPVQAGVPQYITPEKVATHLCAVSDAGLLLIPVFAAQ